MAVERIREVQETGEIFTYPTDFDPLERQKQAFSLVGDDPLDVELWFSSHQARYIRERNWTEKQEIIEQNDGSIILKMQTSGRFDIKKWILGYGADAEVLGPVSLQKNINKEIYKNLNIQQLSKKALIRSTTKSAQPSVLYLI